MNNSPNSHVSPGRKELLYSALIKPGVWLLDICRQNNKQIEFPLHHMVVSSAKENALGHLRDHTDMNT